MSIGRSEPCFRTALLLLCLLFAVSLVSGEGFEAQIIDSNVNVRQAPSTKAKVLTKVQRGDAVTVLERTKLPETVGGQTAFWFHVNFQGGTGWVFGAFLQSLSDSLVPLVSPSISVLPAGDRWYESHAFLWGINGDSLNAILSDTQGVRAVLINNTLIDRSGTEKNLTDTYGPAFYHLFQKNSVFVGRDDAYIPVWNRDESTGKQLAPNGESSPLVVGLLSGTKLKTGNYFVQPNTYLDNYLRYSVSESDRTLYALIYTWTSPILDEKNERKAAGSVVYKINGVDGSKIAASYLPGIFESSVDSLGLFQSRDGYLFVFGEHVDKLYVLDQDLKLRLCVKGNFNGCSFVEEPWGTGTRVLVKTGYKPFSILEIGLPTMTLRSSSFTLDEDKLAKLGGTKSSRFRSVLYTGPLIKFQGQYFFRIDQRLSEGKNDPLPWNTWFLFLGEDFLPTFQVQLRDMDYDARRTFKTKNGVYIYGLDGKNLNISSLRNLDEFLASQNSVSDSRPIGTAVVPAFEEKLELPLPYHE